MLWKRPDVENCSTWPNQVGEVLGMSWFLMAFLTSANISGMIPLIFLFFAPFSQGVFAASQGLSMGPRKLPGIPFACLLPLLAALNGMVRSGSSFFAFFYLGKIGTRVNKNPIWD